MTDVVIPVKDLSRAKGRLQNILTPAERAGLVLAMLRDLLTTLNQCALGDIWLVARDEAVFDLGAEFGVHDIREHVSKGYNHGVSAGLQSVNAQNSVVILPADLPLAQPHDIAQLIQAGAGINPTVAIVPDRHNRGTNGLFLSAPDLITPDFGESSLFNHKVAAAQLRISARVFLSKQWRWILIAQRIFLRWLNRRHPMPLRIFWPPLRLDKLRGLHINGRSHDLRFKPIHTAPLRIR